MVSTVNRLKERRTCVPISNSTTSILSAITGGLFPLLSALLSIWIASVWNWSEKRGHWKVNDMTDVTWISFSAMGCGESAGQ